MRLSIVRVRRLWGRGMTRIFLGTFESVMREHPSMRKFPEESVRSAIGIMRSSCHAATIVHGDFPIIIYSFREPDAVRILTHEENHRAMLAIGEADAARALDHPWAQKAIEGRRTGANYRLLNELFESLSASPKTEAR